MPSRRNHRQNGLNVANPNQQKMPLKIEQRPDAPHNFSVDESGFDQPIH
jgi:hypothetical protein